MRVKFKDIIKSHVKDCKKCFQLVYFLPIEIEKDIVEFLEGFGEPKYDLDILSLLQIESDDGYTVKGRLTNNYLYLSLPIKFKKMGPARSRKQEFEDCISKWIENRLQITIIK